MALLKATYSPRLRVAAAIITRVAVFPVPAPATNAKSRPATKMSLAATCSSVGAKAISPLRKHIVRQWIIVGGLWLSGPGKWVIIARASTRNARDAQSGEDRCGYEP